MTAREYYGSILQLLTTSTVVTSQQIEFDEQDIYIAYLKGSVNLVDGSTLFFAQYVQIERAGRGQITRKKYRYHWQASGGETRYRWDNARHYPGLATFPDHVHIGPEEEAWESAPADLVVRHRPDRKSHLRLSLLPFDWLSAAHYYCRRSLQSLASVG